MARKRISKGATSLTSDGFLLDLSASFVQKRKPGSTLLSETYPGECQASVLVRRCTKGTLTTKTGGWCRQDRLRLKGRYEMSSLYDEQKRVTGFLKIVHNYSEHKRLDNQRISLVETSQKKKKKKRLNQ